MLAIELYFMYLFKFIILNNYKNIFLFKGFVIILTWIIKEIIIDTCKELEIMNY